MCWPVPLCPGCVLRLCCASPCHAVLCCGFIGYLWAQDSLCCAVPVQAADPPLGVCRVCRQGHVCRQSHVCRRVAGIICTTVASRLPVLHCVGSAHLLLYAVIALVCCCIATLPAHAELSCCAVLFLPACVRLCATSNASCSSSSCDTFPGGGVLVCDSWQGDRQQKGWPSRASVRRQHPSLFPGDTTTATGAPDRSGFCQLSGLVGGSWVGSWGQLKQPHWSGMH